MRPLQLILAASDPAQWRAGIMVTAAHAAHGAPTYLHLDAAAVGALAEPAVAEQLAEARAIGVVLTACPTGLADQMIDPDRFADIETLGLVALMATLDDAARLIVL